MKLGITGDAGHFNNPWQSDIGTRQSGVREKARKEVPTHAETLRESGVYEKGSHADAMMRQIARKRETLKSEREDLQERLETILDISGIVGQAADRDRAMRDVAPSIRNDYEHVRDLLVNVNGMLEILRLKEQEVGLDAEVDPEQRKKNEMKLIELQGMILDLEKKHGMLVLEDVPLEGLGLPEKEAAANEQSVDRAA